MNLDRIRDRITAALVIFLGCGLAVMCGKLAGSGQFGMISWIAAAAVYAFALLVFKDGIWVFVPLCWPLTGRIELLPLPFSVRDIAVMLVVGGMLVAVALKIIRLRPKFTFLDALLWINVIWIGTTFLRNPVGFLATDSERVGGRPYFDVLIGMGAYWSLCRAVGSPKVIRALPPLILAIAFVVFVVNVALYYVPQLMPYVLPFYSGFAGLQNPTLEQLSAPSDGGVARYEFFRDICRQSAVFLCAYYPPFSLLIPTNIGRFLAFVATFVGLLLSGFRGFVIMFAALFVLSCYFRRGFGSASKAIGLGVVAAYLLLFLHAIHPLPLSAQRALSFMPSFLRFSKLEDEAVESGTESTRWRVEMWKQALTTDRYIQDKWLGDGFGVMKWQYNAASAIASRTTDYHATQETMAIMGDFHSGPISTIRVAGYVGLAMFMTLLVLLARRAAQLIRRSQGTPFELPAYFFCLPIVFEPLWFVFVFGGFNMAPAWAALSLGVLKLLENSLNRWESQKGGSQHAESSVKSLQDHRMPGIPSLSR